MFLLAESRNIYIYMYNNILFKSKTEIVLGFAPIPEVYTQNPRFSKTSYFLKFDCF